jgi:hypothetical protein
VTLAVRTVGDAVAPEALAEIVGKLGMLEDVIRHPAFRFLDVVVQDEYTHDVIVATSAVFLVFDAT